VLLLLLVALAAHLEHQARAVVVAPVLLTARAGQVETPVLLIIPVRVEVDGAVTAETQLLIHTNPLVAVVYLMVAME
jgi:hypothetical protein